MTTYSKVPLSASIQGRAIKVGATVSPGTVAHTTGISATALDEVWLYGTNNDTAAVVVTVQFGGTTAGDDEISATLPPKSGFTLLVPGLILFGNGSSGRPVQVYASVANKVTVNGYVHRIA